MENTFLGHLQWRNAEKNFDPEKKVSEENLQKILNATRMAPTSFGLQPIHVYVVSDPAVKEKLREAGYNQAQFTDCSHVLVFADRSDMSQRITDYIELASGGDENVKEKMRGYEDMMRGSLESRSEEGKKSWANRQVYLALGFALAACAELEIDSCPMEGLDAAKFDEILKTPEHINVVVAMAIGYRKQEPERAKVRFPESDLFTKV